MKETQIDELKTLPEAPDTLHLNIGLKGKLHTYHREVAEAAPEQPSEPSVHELRAAAEALDAAAYLGVDLANGPDESVDFKFSDTVDLSESDEHVDDELFDDAMADADIGTATIDIADDDADFDDPVVMEAPTPSKKKKKSKSKSK